VTRSPVLRARGIACLRIVIFATLIVAWQVGPSATSGGRHRQVPRQGHHLFGAGDEGPSLPPARHPVFAQAPRL